MVDGKTTLSNGKIVTMTDQKFYLCAYGDCTNPGIALKPGMINIPGA